MRWGKYIIIEHMGHEVAICFSDLIDHSAIGQDMKVISAGQFEVGSETSFTKGTDITVSTFDKSTTLDKVSRKEDADIIKEMLHYEDIF